MAAAAKCLQQAGCTVRQHRHVALAAGLVLFVGCSGGSGGDGATTTTPTTPAAPVLTSLTVSLSPNSIEVGQTVVATASGLDQRNAPIATGTVTWTSTNPSVASVSATGAVSGIAAGQANIVGAIGSVQGQAAATVILAPVATLSVAPTTHALGVGATRQFVATAVDSRGATLAGRTITWTSSDTAKVKVSSGGLVTAVALGISTITATAEGKSASATVTVAVSPQLTAVAPGSLVPGAAATITGARFSTTLTDNVVLIRGVAAAVTAATATQLTVTVPCIETGTAPVQVVTGGVASPSLTTAVASDIRTLTVGQSVVTSGGCLGISSVSGAARFLVSIVSMGTGANTQTDFELRGTPTATTAAERPPVFSSLRAAAARAPTAADHADREHFERLEAERRFYEQVRARGELRNAGDERASDPTMRAIAALGDKRSFYFGFSTPCSDTSQIIRAKAIYVGTKAVIWEDTANALQSSLNSTVDGYYRRAGQLFDQEQYDIVRSTFGDPLIRDAALDGDGRVNMIFTERVNSTSSAAFVTSYDGYARSVCARSNVGEFFYSRAPTTGGSNVQNSTHPDGWFAFFGRTVIHEVKHIASLSSRMAKSAAWEESWLEEGTARHAEEVWVRAAMHRVSWKGNTGFGSANTNGLYCDFTLAPACDAVDPVHRPSFGMQRHFNEILPKWQQPWNWSIYGDGTGQTGSVFYNTVWSLVRYAIDRYGTSDAAFLTALTSSTATGLTNLAAVAGASADQLLAGWSLALYADDYPGLPSSPDLSFPTWNLRNIYAALNADPAFASRFTSSYPLVPTALPLGAFTVTQSGVRGGAAAYYVLSGTMSATQMLDLRAVGGGAPSSLLRIAVARLP